MQKKCTYIETRLAYYLLNESPVISNEQLNSQYVTEPPATGNAWAKSPMISMYLATQCLFESAHTRGTGNLTHCSPGLWCPKDHARGRHPQTAEGGVL